MTTAPIAAPQATEDLAESLRNRFTPANRAATLKCLSAVFAAIFLREIGQMNGEQLQAVAQAAFDTLGIPSAIPVGVAIYERWRADR